MGVACLEFRRENFRGWRENHEIRESFLSRKFPAIRYAFCFGGKRISLARPGQVTKLCQLDLQVCSVQFVEVPLDLSLSLSYPHKQKG